MAERVPAAGPAAKASAAPAANPFAVVQSSRSQEVVNPLDGIDLTSANMPPPFSIVHAGGLPGLSPPVAMMKSDVESDRPPRRRLDCCRCCHGFDWCTGNSIVGVLLLLLTFVTAGLYFVMQVTPAISRMLDFNADVEVRVFLGINVRVQVVCWVFCFPAMIVSLMTLGQITCCWKRTLRQIARDDLRTAEMNTNWAACAVFRCLDFIFFSPNSRYFFLINFAFEIAEFVFQALAVVAFSQAGVGQAGLALYTSILLVNATTPLALSWITHRSRDASLTPQARLQQCHLISRVILLDAACDVLYTAFPICHLIISFMFDQSGSRKNHAIDLMVNSEIEQKGLANYLLFSEAKNTFFGADTVLVAFVKAVSRVFPLFLAPIRIRRAFVTRRQVAITFVVRKSRETGPPPPPQQQQQQQDRDSGGEVELVERQRQPSTAAADLRTRSALQAVRLAAKNAVYSAAAYRNSRRWSIWRSRKEGASSRRRSIGGRPRFNRVPWWASILLSLTAITFCLVVFVRIGTWDHHECSASEIKDACAVRAFPLFSVYYELDRSCACSTLALRDQNCAPNRRGGSHNATPQYPFASSILNRSAAILSSTQMIYVEACNTDSSLLEVVSTVLKAPSVLIISIHNVDAQQSGRWHKAHTDCRASSSAMRPPADIPVWNTPREFGCESQSSSCWPLSILHIKADTPFFKLASIPETLGRMSSLTELNLEGIGGDSVPSTIFALSNLIHLGFSTMDLSRHGALPSSVGRLTGLVQLRVQDCRLSALPDSVLGMQNLVSLSLRNNNLTTLVGVEALAAVKRARFDNNDLVEPRRSLDAVAKMTALESLTLSNTGLRVLPSTFAALTRLRIIELDGNKLAEIPASIMAMVTDRDLTPFRLDLERNNISGSSLTTMLAAIPTSAASSPVTPSRLLLLVGGNTACTNTTAAHVGPWRIKCVPECSPSCRETGNGDDAVAVNLGDGGCDCACNTAACLYDAGDCARL